MELLEIAPVIDPPPPALQELLNRPTPQFTPPFPSQNEPIKVLCKEQDPLSLFIHFLGHESIWLMCEATNKRAETFYTSDGHTLQEWQLLTPQEFHRWFALLFYISSAYQTRRADYWRQTEFYRHDLGRFMNRNRWDEIHRFWSINNAPRQLEDPWWYKIEPLMSGVRASALSGVIYSVFSSLY